MLEQKQIDVCFVQEIRWKEISASHLADKEQQYKFFCAFNSKGASEEGMVYCYLKRE